MEAFSQKDILIGAYRGRIAASRVGADGIEWLAQIALKLQDAVVMTSGRNLNARASMPLADGRCEVVIKRFDVPSGLALRRVGRVGSKARRTWNAAVHLTAHGVGTPLPLAFLERWDGKRLVESYVVTLYAQGISSFGDELVHLYREEPDGGKLLALMQVVAEAIKRMHDAGFVHLDLGNQNILLRREGETSWGDVQVIDLNRGRIREEVSLDRRARDLSRINLPSDFLRIFWEMYWGGDIVPPAEFRERESRYRRRYAWHAKSRRWRHPIRERRRVRKPGDPPAYPDAKSIWIWDEKSGQALVTMVSKDRSQYYPWRRHAAVCIATLRWLPRIWRLYRQQLAASYAKPVTMAGRLGVAVEWAPDRGELFWRRLADLGTLPIMVRFYHHRGDVALGGTAEWVDRLVGAGHEVHIALVQDRRAIEQPEKWRDFVDAVLSRVGKVVRSVEVGHAVNRVKWGLWDFREYGQLMAPVLPWQSRLPEVDFTGPAVIDFEYHYIPAALDAMPGGIRFGALSHHLYVDRRGAPENRQGRFALLEKLALGRAIACAHPRVEDRFVVSEFNWPLRGTGVHSPVGAPYVSPGERHGDPSVDEEDAAAYLLRYVLIALCSGLAERVFWWRLVAHGYGLVDDAAPDALRCRAGYEVLRVFLARLGAAVFERKDELRAAAGQAVHAYCFRCPDGEETWVVYTEAAPCKVALPEGMACVCDARGAAVQAADGLAPVTGMPSYWMGGAAAGCDV